MTTVLIGLDDTDNPVSRGTGWLARQLLKECTRRGCVPLTVSRHQFPLDERIAYTTHNSGACVAVEADDARAVTFAFDFVAERSAEGSDPGVCISALDEVPDAVKAFGRRSAVEVVEQSEAIELARREGVALRELGGTGLGVIGALGSVGLRATGNDGRIIQLPGLRELPDRVGADAFARLGIRIEHRADRAPRPDDIYETLGWVRPNLVGGEPVLPVEWNEKEHGWLPVERKRSRPLA